MNFWDFRGAYKPTGGKVGVRTGGAGRKGCTKGKPCGATCISAKKECWVDLPGGKPGSSGGRNLHDSTSKVRDLVKARTGKGGSATPQPKPQPQPQPQTRTEAQKAAADLKQQRRKEREAKIAEKTKAGIGKDMEAKVPKRSPQQPTPQPQPQPKKENVREVRDRVSAGVRDWVNKFPPGQFKDEAAKEKFIKDKTREALKKELEPRIRQAQNERLRREFAPKDGKVRSMGLNGKTDEEGSAAINNGLDSIRKNSADANKKVDTLMKALEKNPITLIGRDVNVKPEDATVSGNVRGLAAMTSNFRGVKTSQKLIETIRTVGLKAEGAYATTDTQVVVMTRDRISKQEKIGAKKATDRLKQATVANPMNWRWSDGAGATYLHEVGHVMHARAFKGKSQKEIMEETESQLKSLGIKSVSQYGKTNAMETTAELYAAYMMNGPQLKKEMPAAYQWIDTLVQNAYNYNP